MKKYESTFIFLFTILCICLNVHQQIQAQENKQQIQEKTNYVIFQHIISKLTFTSRISKSTEQINEELIKEIKERKVDFVLTSKDEEELKKAGASYLLVETIGENASEKVRERLIEKMYSINCDKDCSSHQKSEQNIELSKQYIRVFEDSPEHKALIDYLKVGIPQLEKKIAEYKQIKQLETTRNKFDQAYKDGKWDELFEIGAEILKNEPEFVDVAIILASVGYDKIAKKNPKSKKLVETVYYAEKAINLLKTTESKTKMYGEYDYVYKTEEFPDGKANALGWMNYIIGYIKYFHLNEKEAALPYFQKSLEYKSEVKKFAETMPIPKD